MKRHACRHCGFLTDYTIERPRHCAGCGQITSVFASQSPPPPQPRAAPRQSYQNYEEDDEPGDYDIDELMKFIGGTPVSNSISFAEIKEQAKYGFTGGDNNIVGDGPRQKMSKKEFKEYEKRMMDKSTTVFKMNE